MRKVYFTDMKFHRSVRYLHFGFLVELICLVICPTPFYEKYVYLNGFETEEGRGLVVKQVRYFLSDMLFVCMFSRFIFLARSIFNKSIYRDEHSKKVCRMHSASSGVKFTFKCLLEVTPEYTIMWLFIFNVLVIGYIFRIFELPYDILKNAKTTDEMTFIELYFNAIYVIVVTMTTVGYGDIVPHTLPGKALILFSSVWGAFLISLVVLIVSSVFDLDKNQKKAMRDIHISRQASRAIRLSVKFFLAKK